jgi:hypothetical protein
MTKVKFISIAFFVLLFIGSRAQNIKDETVEYRYIKLPLSPLPSAIKNYQSSIFAPYEEENKKKES